MPVDVLFFTVSLLMVFPTVAPGYSHHPYGDKNQKERLFHTSTIFNIRLSNIFMDLSLINHMETSIRKK